MISNEMSVKVLRVLRYYENGATIKELSWRLRADPKQVYYALLELLNKKIIIFEIDNKIKYWKIP